MSIINHIDNDFSYIKECECCHKKFKVYETEQIPGFRFPEDLVCPYCGELLITSTSYEFRTEKIDGEEEKE